jgi:hypothetical protein
MFGNERDDRFKRKAVTTIQCAYRCHLARVTARDRYRSKFRKVYDNDAKQYIYQNKTNLEIDIKLPAFFKRETLPSPRDLEAPIDYNPGNELNSDGCAIIITNIIFPLGKWIAQAPPELENDHEQIVELLNHEFIGRMRPENVLSLKNPSCEDVRSAFRRLRQVSRSNGFVFIYIATHIITITKSDPENKKENAYFAFKNSEWTKNTELVESCISFTDMSKLINKIPCKDKTILLNYAHHSPPRKVLFPASKLLYLPSNCLQRLSDLCKAPVIGSCAFGFNIREYMKYHPGVQFDPEHSHLFGSKKLFGSKSIALNEKKKLLQKNSSSAVAASTEGSALMPPTLNENELIQSEEVKKGSGWSSASVYESDLWKSLLKDFQIPPIPSIYKTPKPEKPGATWKQTSGPNKLIEVELPSQTERQNYERTVLYWKIRRGMAKPVNVFKQLHLQYKKYSLASPEQTSIIYKG